MLKFQILDFGCLNVIFVGIYHDFRSISDFVKFQMVISDNLDVQNSLLALL